jgi:hypothetical protein
MTARLLLRAPWEALLNQALRDSRSGVGAGLVQGVEMGLEVVSGCSSVASSPCAWAWQARRFGAPYSRPLSPTRFSAPPVPTCRDTGLTACPCSSLPAAAGPRTAPPPAPARSRRCRTAHLFPCGGRIPYEEPACSEPACSRPPRPRHGRHPPATPTTSSNAPGFPIRPRRRRRRSPTPWPPPAPPPPAPSRRVARCSAPPHPAGLPGDRALREGLATAGMGPDGGQEGVVWATRVALM